MIVSKVIGLWVIFVLYCIGEVVDIRVGVFYWKFI